MQHAMNAAEHGVAMISQWKPIKPETFAEAIHRYSVVRADDYGNGGLSQKSYTMDRDAICTIYHLKKEVDGPVSSPVLLSMRYSGGRMVYFASTKYGDLTDDTGKVLRAER